MKEQPYRCETCITLSTMLPLRIPSQYSGISLSKAQCGYRVQFLQFIPVGNLHSGSVIVCFPRYLPY